MAQNQVSKQNEELPSETLTPMLEWGPWFLWNLASVTAGGLAIRYIFFGGYVGTDGVSASFGGIIGGIIVGWMPWLAQKYQISKIGWRICAAVSITLTVIAVVLVFNDPHSYSEMYIGYWVFPSVLGSSLIGTIAREIGHRNLKSQVTWWQWALAIVLIFIIGFAMVGFAALTSLV